MSHVSRIELEIQSLEHLKGACRKLGFSFRDHQKTYQWYGRWVGDSPLPEGISEEELGTCDHAISVPDCAYEIGVVKRGARYLLLWDSWHAGGLARKIGKDAGILKQGYAVERITGEAKRKKCQVREIRSDQSVRLILRV